jgi:hypothetical protein
MLLALSASAPPGAALPRSCPASKTAPAPRRGTRCSVRSSRRRRVPSRADGFASREHDQAVGHMQTSGREQTLESQHRGPHSCTLFRERNVPSAAADLLDEDVMLGF